MQQGPWSYRTKAFRNQGEGIPEEVASKLKDGQGLAREVQANCSSHRDQERACLIWELKVVCSSCHSLVDSSRTLHPQVVKIFVI